MAMESPIETFNFGKSIIVPSVQELAKESLDKVPPRYLRLDQDPPIIPIDGSSSVPVIDLQKLILGNGDSMDSELQKLHSACKDWGFFQVVNHGVSFSFLDEFKSEVEKLFKLPYEEKKKLWQKPDNNEGFGQLFVVSEEQKLDWSDLFCIKTFPLNSRNNDLFDKLPPKFSESLKTYCGETKRIASEILGQMAKALKMDSEEMKGLVCDGLQSARMNYYPPCPEPEKAIGVTPHSDASALTVLLQINETPGLQIRHHGNWLPVVPLPNAFIVNIGDIMEIVSNGVYRSIEHRATVNSTKERLSVATFYCSNWDSVVGPAASLTGPHNPPIFHQLPMHKYLHEFFLRKLNGKSFLDFMRIAYHEN